MIELSLSPVEPDLYAVMLDGRELCRSPRPTFVFNVARMLLADGVPPETRLVIRYAGHPRMTRHLTVGEAGAWTVEVLARGRPRKARSSRKAPPPP